MADNTSRGGRAREEMARGREGEKLEDSSLFRHLLFFFFCFLFLFFSANKRPKGIRFHLDRLQFAVCVGAREDINAKIQETKRRRWTERKKNRVREREREGGSER